MDAGKCRVLRGAGASAGSSNQAHPVLLKRKLALDVGCGKTGATRSTVVVSISGLWTPNQRRSRWRPRSPRRPSRDVDL